MRYAIILTVILLSACATTEQNKVTGALATPLNDLNLAQGAIPEVLIAAQQAPYAATSEMSCAVLSASVNTLDEALGPDIDTPSTASHPSLVERGSSAVAGAVQKTAEGVIPFRGWVRKLSGAERHSKQVSAAIAAGTARRAFLKGIIWAKGCIADGGDAKTTAPEALK